MAGSTASASTSRPPSDGERTASTQTRRSSRRSPETRFFAGRVSSPSLGTSASAATGSGPLAPPSPNGTTASATPRAASGAAMPACAARSPLASPARATCSFAPPRPRRASTSSSRTTASPSPTWCRTRRSTTRRTASATGTEPTRNYSWNHGVEGPSEDPTIVAARARDQRNLLTLLFASRGTPMLAMGSELGFSQGGNNNAYAQDNATTAIHWSDADASLIAFVQRLAEARRAHPALSRDAFLTGEKFDASGLPDVEWRDAEGPMTQSAWNDPAGPALVAVFAAPHDGGVDRVAVAMNRSNEEAELSLPEPRSGMAWRALVDSHDPESAGAPARHRRPPAPPRPLMSHPRGKPSSRRRTSRRSADGRNHRGARKRRRDRRRMVGRQRQTHHRLAGNQDRAPGGARARGGQRSSRRAKAWPASSTRRDGGASPIRSCLTSTGRSAPRCATRPKAARPGSNARTGGFSSGASAPARDARRDLPDGRTVEERTIALPDLPLGRSSPDRRRRRVPAHGRAGGMLRARGRRAQALRGHRPTLRAASRRRSGDRRLLDAGARRRSGGRRGRGLFRREPHAYAVPARPGAGEPLQSVRPPFSRSDADRRSRRRPAARRGARGGAPGACAGHRGGKCDEARRLSGGMGGQARGARRAPCGFRSRPPRAACGCALRRPPRVRRGRRRTR